jgi:hypothetical protein
MIHCNILFLSSHLFYHIGGIYVCLFSFFPFLRLWFFQPAPKKRKEDEDREVQIQNVIADRGIRSTFEASPIIFHYKYL